MRNASRILRPFPFYKNGHHTNGSHLTRTISNPMKFLILFSVLWPAVVSGIQSCGGSTAGCTSLVSCSSRFNFGLDSCVLQNGQDVGVCCPDPAAVGTKSPLQHPADSVDGPARVVPPEEVRKAAERGRQRVDQLMRLESQLVAKGVAKKGHGRLQIKATPSADVRDRSLRALRIVEASKSLQRSWNVNAEEIRRWMAASSLKQTVLEDSCAEEIDCSSLANSKYRSADGSCNNVAHPTWGQEATTFQRILPPAYGNGIDSPRLASDGSELANARRVSVEVVSIYGHNDPTNTTLAVMTWGQFVTHDMALAADYTFEDGSLPMCCTSDHHLPAPEDLHPQCLSIDVGWDPIYNNNRINVSCMALTRSQIGDDFSCTLNHAQQLNSNSHWLDGSPVYGSDLATSNRLRMGRDGLMETSESQGRQLLPVGSGCSDHPFAVCFQAGDRRVEENPQLAIMHTLLLREHNRIAGTLKELNPHWTDDALFEETRRIVVAEIQHVTYNEYLPILLGADNARDYGLSPLEGHGRDYNDSLNPSVTNEFTAAVFRVAHSSIQGYLELFDANDEEDAEQSFSLSSYFFDASRLLQTGFIDAALRGLTKQPPQRIDVFYSSEVTMNLYREGRNWGQDLVAITVQRGREHGVAGYNEYRQLCGLPKVTTFEELSAQMDDFAIASLQKVYESVDDIDLYIGCLAETPLADSRVGPTAACIIGDQFSRLKKADRYFYDAANQAGSFTPEQLNQIRASSLARIICDNNDGAVTHMQPLAMRSPYGTNERVPCHSIPSMDLTLWKE